LNPRARTLPEPFRAETVNGEANSLYFQFRNPQFLTEGLNETIIDILQRPRFEALLREPVLLTSPPRNGFSNELESTLHDAIHSAVGLREGMGSPEFAARDPIFWIHHANIDRLWESWRLPERDGTSSRDPAANNPWRAIRFRFVDSGGQEATADIALSLLAATNLGYRYDRLEPVQAPPSAFLPASALKAPTMLLESAGAQKAIRTPQDIVTVPLVPSQMQSAIADVTRNPAVRYELSIDLNSGSEPGIYQVFLTSREKEGAMSAEKKIGAFSLFSARGSQIHQHKASDAKVDTTIRIDITDQVKNNVVNPNKAAEIVIRPSYLAETVSVLVKNVKIIAK
ncbi:MAG TPA: tyrosinase family protein, partial [Geobacterales bacterium]|nr:tyrosinase family protein [Geobacterales bacterium]